jgi:hypothetical protein
LIREHKEIIWICIVVHIHDRFLSNNEQQIRYDSDRYADRFS